MISVTALMLSASALVQMWSVLKENLVTEWDRVFVFQFMYLSLGLQPQLFLRILYFKS